MQRIFEFLKRHMWILVLIFIALVALFIYVRREMREPIEPVEIPESLEGIVSTSTSEEPEDTIGKAARFKYPETLPTTYITAVDWPPDIFLNEEGYECTEAGSTTDRAGRTETRTINGREYCVTEVEEGAAGSVYTQYAYMTTSGEETFTLTFSTRSVQCGNYDEIERLACERERAGFSLDTLVEQMVATVQFEER